MSNIVEYLRSDYCSCLDAYKDRGRIDPQCESCNTKDERIEAADTIESLRAENAAQALLIASLKDERDMWQELHSKTNDQLSDTQRQNAELVQRVGEAEKDAYRWTFYRDNAMAWIDDMALHDWIEKHCLRLGGRSNAIGAAIAASKVSNDVEKSQVGSITMNGNQQTSAAEK